MVLKHRLFDNEAEWRGFFPIHPGWAEYVQKLRKKLSLHENSRIMHKQHNRWHEFRERLAQELAKSPCIGQMGCYNARRVLAEMALDVDESIDFFINLYWLCDCSILNEGSGPHDCNAEKQWKWQIENANLENDSKSN